MTGDPTTGTRDTAPAGDAAPAGPARPAVAGIPAEGEWRRLNARMLLIHPVQELVRAIPALAGVVLASSRTGQGEWWGLATAGVLVVLGTLRWFTTTYRITADQVQVRRGLLRRRELSTPLDRVRTIDVTAHFLHRILGLARVSVGTGRSDRKDGGEIKLDALAAADAAALRDELLHRRDRLRDESTVADRAAPAGTASTVDAKPAAGRRPARTGPPERELARLRTGWVRYGPFTLSGLIAIGVVAGFVSRVASDAHYDLRRFGPLRAGLSWYQHTPLVAAIVVLVLAGVLLVAAVSTVGYVLSFWNFRLTRHREGTLHVSRGLITSRATTLEERRIRGVELSEPMLLRWVRGARCIAIATGLRVGRGAERGGSLLLPPAPRAEAVRVAGEVLRKAVPVTAELAPHGPAARRRRFTRALVGCALLIGLVVLAWWLFGLPAWVWQASLALVPLALPVAADRYRSLGHALVDGTLVTRFGSLVRRRCMVSCDGVVGWKLRRSLFQRRLGLATLTATTAAGRQGYPVPDVDLTEAVRLADRATPGLLTPFLTTGS